MPMMTYWLIPLLAAAGGEPQELDAMKREIEALRTEVAALRFALFEMARTSRQQADNLDRALRSAGAQDAAQPRAEEPEQPAKQEKQEKQEKGRAKKAEEAASVARKASRREATPASGTITGKVRVPEGEPVAYVYVENLPGSLASGKRVQMDQLNKQFVPAWAVVEKGTEIAFPNGDNIYHNVFSRSPGNSFDLGMYRKGDDAKVHRFIKPGPVDVFCNIHPRMAASLLVVPNRYFSKVQADGSFVIDNVPAGKRKVVAWAPGSSISSAWVDLTDRGTASLELKLDRKDRGHANKDGRPYGSYP